MKGSNKDGKIVRRTLDLLIDSAESFEELSNIKFMIDDYADEGYYIKPQIQRYNTKVNKFYAKRN